MSEGAVKENVLVLYHLHLITIIFRVLSAHLYEKQHGSKQIIN